MWLCKYWCHQVEMKWLYNKIDTWAATWKNQQCGCAPREDSDQPGHPPSLIRVFAVHMKKAWVISYPVSAQQRLIRLGGCAGWSESSLGAQSLCWFCHVAAHLSLLYGETRDFSFAWRLEKFCQMSHVTRKPNFGGLRLGKTQTCTRSWWD